MALTLVEAAKLNPGEVERNAIIQIYAENSDVLRTLPFVTIAGNSLKYVQESALPGIAFRGYNEGYTASTGVLNPVTEHLAISGGELDVDRQIIRSMGADIRSAHEALKVKALASVWNQKFIKGDTTSDPKEFDGIQIRATGSQLIPAGSTANGDALSLLLLDTLIDAVDSPTGLIMSQQMRRRLTVAARDTAVGGYITYALDEFGRRVTQYNGLNILIADGNGDANPGLAFDEVCPGGGTNTGTSIYCVSFGEGMCQGLQNSLPEVEDLGDLKTTPQLRTRVEWLSGMAVFHPRSIARLWGISDAAVVD